jgi:hypothetical protein
MKVSKKLLKQIVKECLIEILTEGLGSIVPTSPAIYPSTVPGTNRDVLMAGQMMERYVPPEPMETPMPRRQAPPPTPSRLNQQVASAVKELASATRDPMMASIFADTARSTLMEQGINDRPIQTVDPRADRAAKIVDAVPPEQLFGDEAASKWAALAFMPGTKKV